MDFFGDKAQPPRKDHVLSGPASTGRIQEKTTLAQYRAFGNVDYRHMRYDRTFCRLTLLNPVC
jgi:hypothetical protein